VVASASGTGPGIAHLLGAMRALVVTSNPDAALSNPSSPAGALRDLGCEVLTVGYDIDSLPEDIEVRRPSVAVVDAGAHLEVGRAAIRRMREIGSLTDVPVLLCVEASRLVGLLNTEVGADDFVVRPFVASELYARIRQLDWRMSSFRGAGRIKIEDLMLDVVAADVWYRGRAVKLPRQEFHLLRFLAEHPGRPFSRQQLLARVWGYRYAGETRTVDIHVRRLRGNLGAGCAMIETVRHLGYRMRAPATLGR
jgi:two-component system, OmpR family, alkaline phosphatase synthesis response regulator PhoP